MVRIGISSYLSTQEDIEVVGEGASGKDAITKAHELKPDLILMVYYGRYGWCRSNY